MIGLKGKRALVSAASSGIGMGIARVLSAYGVSVHIFSRNSERVSAAAEMLSRETGNRVSYSAADLTRREDLERVFKESENELGSLPDFLIINYGDPRVAPFLDLTDDDWDYSIDLILKSSVFMVKRSLPHMMKHGGRIVFVTSLTTKEPLKNFALSASLRSAVVSLSKVISLEYSEHGITSNSISQGYVMTQRLENIARMNSEKQNVPIDKIYEDMKSTVPSRRFGRPEEIGELVAFLCSDAASYINGVNLQIDGGFVKFPF